VCRYEHADVLRYLSSVRVADLEVDPAEPAAVRGASPPLEKSRHTAGGDHEATRHRVGHRTRDRLIGWPEGIERHPHWPV
jgi:hypothetical protein